MCTCGESKLHIIARRKTFDDKLVLGWSDGAVTFGLGLFPRGVGRLRSSAQLRYQALVLDLCGLYDAAELGALIHAARASLVQTAQPREAFVRRHVAGERFSFNGRVLRKKPTK